MANATVSIGIGGSGTIVSPGVGVIVSPGKIGVMVSAGVIGVTVSVGTGFGAGFGCGSFLHDADPTSIIRPNSKTAAYCIALRTKPWRGGGLASSACSMAQPAVSTYHLPESG